jgi:hypothetical protein
MINSRSVICEGYVARMGEGRGGGGGGGEEEECLFNIGGKAIRKDTTRKTKL